MIVEVILMGFGLLMNSKNLFVRVLIFIKLLFLSDVSVAATTVSGEVARIYPNGNWISFRLKNDTCNSGKDYYRFDMTATQGSHLLEIRKAWLSMLIAAINTQKPIRVSVADCEPGHKTIRYLFQDA